MCSAQIKHLFICRVLRTKPLLLFLPGRLFANPYRLWWWCCLRTWSVLGVVRPRSALVLRGNGMQSGLLGPTQEEKRWTRASEDAAPVCLQGRLGSADSKASSRAHIPVCYKRPSVSFWGIKKKSWRQNKEKVCVFSLLWGELRVSDHSVYLCCLF